MEFFSHLRGFKELKPDWFSQQGTSTVFQLASLLPVCISGNPGYRTYALIHCGATRPCTEERNGPLIKKIGKRQARFKNIRISEESDVDTRQLLEEAKPSSGCVYVVKFQLLSWVIFLGWCRNYYRCCHAYIHLLNVLYKYYRKKFNVVQQ